MKLNILTVIGLSTMLFACGGDNSEDDASDDSDAEIESLVGDNFADQDGDIEEIEYDSVGVSGNEANDLSFVRGVEIGQQLIRQKLDFLDPKALAEQWVAFAKNPSLITSAEEADSKLSELAKATQSFKTATEEQKVEMVNLFALIIYDRGVLKPAIENLNLEKVAEGLVGSTYENKIPTKELFELYSDYSKKAYEKLEAENLKKIIAEGKEKGKKGYEFLAKNAKKPGIKVTKSGLQYEVIKKGSGDKPSATDNVTVHYEGLTIDGKEFDSSYSRGEPTSFVLNKVIKGWTEGVQLMSPGAKYKFYIPQELAYGSQQAGEFITPYSALIFTVELISVQ